MVKNQERSLGNSSNITKLKAELVEYNKQLTESKKAADIEVLVLCLIVN
jgi:hypothetical protein